MQEFTKTNLDKIGEIFFDNGKLFRKINPKYIPHIKQIFYNGFIDELIKRNLFVESEIINDGKDLIVEHKYLEPIIYPFEWTFSMLKNAALKMLEILEVCLNFGIGLQDCHSSNFIFHKNSMIYVDLGTFYCSEFQFPFKEYMESYIFPLVLWSFGLELTIKYSLTWKTVFPAIEYHLITEPNLRNIDRELLFKKIQKNYPVYYKNNPEILINLFEQLKRLITNLNLNIHTDWSEYYRGKFDTKGDLIITERFQKIINYTNHFCKNAETAISLGGNEGAFENELLRKTNLKRIIVQDIDSKALENGFIKYSKRNDNKDIYFAHYDLIWTITHPYWLPAEHRFKSDIVYALALTHHLMLRFGARLDFILSKIASYTKKYSFIEFMPLGLWVPGAKVDIPSWYTEEYFQKYFKKYFKIIFKEQLEANRILYIGVIHQ